MWILSAGRRRTKWNRMMAATIVGCTGLTAQAQPLDLPLLLPTWQHLFTLRAGGGFKDNLTLAHTATQSSPFVATGAEAVIARRSETGTQLSFFLNADDRRYLSSDRVDKEQRAFGQAQLKKVFPAAGGISLTGEHIYHDQILDASGTSIKLR